MATDPVFEHRHVFTRRFLWDAFKRDWLWRIFAVVFGIDCLLAAVLWLYGNPPWEPPAATYVAGILIGAFIAPPVALWKIVGSVYRHWKFESPDCIIDFRFHDDAIEVEMPSGSSRHEWKGLRRLWRYEDVWLLELVKMRSIVMPADMPREVRDFVSERCRAAGVKVKP